MDQQDNLREASRKNIQPCQNHSANLAMLTNENNFATSFRLGSPRLTGWLIDKTAWPTNWLSDAIEKGLLLLKLHFRSSHNFLAGFSTWSSQKRQVGAIATSPDQSITFSAIIDWFNPWATPGRIMLLVIKDLFAYPAVWSSSTAYELNETYMHLQLRLLSFEELC